jgi:DUF1365 family protein
MEMRYHFRISPPADAVKLGILTDRPGGRNWLQPSVDVAARCRRPRYLCALVALPIATLKIVAAIRWRRFGFGRNVFALCRSISQLRMPLICPWRAAKATFIFCASADARVKRALVP